MSGLKMRCKELLCPVCRKKLYFIPDGNVFRCPANHSYDIARQGYVNLLVSNQKKSREPGDSKEMVAARVRFLSGGYYSRVFDAINSCAGKLLNHETDPVILDLGTGEGYYLDGLYRFLETKGSHPICLGIDISRDAVKKAAGKNKNISWIVAGNFHPPVKENSINLILSVFSPVSYSVCSSLLKENGNLLRVLPGKNHLIELREIIYPEITDKNREYLPDKEDGIEVTNRNSVKYTISPDREALLDLLKMTPHYWRTNSERIENLLNVFKGDLTVDMQILELKKVRN